PAAPFPATRQQRPQAELKRYIETNAPLLSSKSRADQDDFNEPNILHGTVGAVYGRAFFHSLCEKRAVIDRPYNPRTLRPLLFIGQSKNVQRVTLVWRIDFRGDDVRNTPRAASSLASRHSDVLLAGDAERHRKTLHCGCEFRLPKHFAGLYVD